MSLSETYGQWSESAAAVLAKSRRVDVADLPGTPTELLSTPIPGGLTVRPLYTRLDETPEPGLPGEFPFVRGADRARDVVLGWRVTERFADDDTAASAVNEQILDACANGTSGLWLRVGEGIDADGLGAALAGVYLDLLPVTLDVGADVAAAEAFLRVLEQAPAAPQEAAPTVATTHSLGLSPLTAAFSGRPGVADSDAVALAVRVADGAHADRVRTLRVDGLDFSGGGADPVTELGLVVAAGVAHVRALVDAGLTAAQALRQITFAISVTDDQFGAIAKLRALRLMWARVAEVLGVPDAGAAVTHAVTDLAMFAQRDPWVNMLRSTVAAFGAGVGGADQVTVHTFDAAIPGEERTSKPAFARRIARNTQLLLLEESNIGRVLDPGGGSWFIESLTDDLADAAWAVFTDVENRGGYSAALADGSIAQRVADALAQRDAAVAKRATPVTGVSEFPNLDEPALSAAASTATDLPGAAPNLARVARHFEALRDRADAVAAAGERPAALLIPLGPIAEHNGRTTFIANLLAAGGIAAINPGPVAADGIAALTAEHSPRVAVLCGTKARYADEGPAALAAAREAGIDRIYLAGPDKEWPDADSPPDGSLRAGIDAVAVLTDLLDLITDSARTGATA
ncbi:methylmalonyl-CoA mutase family protein [uncultured Gordonia sp.]|uniref:methylmalonyl-CoA mutase family protein n=3 Tax=unclassified Gordonia (in: high G+C Gram-positive bacteria) TaxID=2657482 RepID=UPI000FB17903|nr:methylmalonyl-CoA mutase family protein [uncultured Gordonia sp.]RUP35361.1 MAG: methylmalonyl-CoA mutase [Gordonia sp. (in: high G+C Gram-positive bacteria)]